MTEKQKHMLQQALEALSNAYCEKKKYYIAANDYATAKIEDVLAMDEAEERPMTAEDILGIGGTVKGVEEFIEKASRVLEDMKRI